MGDENLNNKPQGESTSPSHGGDMWETSVSSSYGDTPSGNPQPEPATGEDLPGAPDGNTAAPDDKPAPAVQYPIWVNILVIIGVLLVATVIGSLIEVIVHDPAKPDSSLPTFISYAFSFSVTIGFAWWVTNRHGTIRKPMGFSLRKTNPTLILWGLILVIVTSMVLEPLLELFPSKYLDMLQDAVGTGGWAMLTTIIAAPILEEVLFRGIIQNELVNGYGRIRGVIMGAAIFGIIHIIPQQAINAFFIGIILGYIYIRSGSLIPGIVIHAINNALAYIMMQFFGDNFTLTKDLFGNEVFYWVVYSVCVVILLLSGWKLWSELKKLDAPEQEKSSLAA